MALKLQKNYYVELGNGVISKVIGQLGTGMDSLPRFDVLNKWQSL